MHVFENVHGNLAREGSESVYIWNMGCFPIYPFVWRGLSLGYVGRMQAVGVVVDDCG